ncbi:MAG: DUF1972 domain-containing protein [Chitinophagaceae bacterium]
MGSRGIPNYYGGFEQFAQYLSAGLQQRGHEVFVYNSHRHPYKKTKWNGVHIIHCKDPEQTLGTAGQFLYDRNCLRDARNRNFDVLLHLGYTSDSIWHRHWPGEAINIVNMDGLEWQRKKYNRLTRWFLKKAESLAARKGNVLVADSPVIKEYLEKKYQKEAHFIPYAAEVFSGPDPVYLQRFNLQPGAYYLLIARMVPENNIEMIIRGFLASSAQYPLLIIGDTSNRFGSYITSVYNRKNIHYPGPLYDQVVLNNLRFYCAGYFHGHSAGGTNPSLLEAMACGCDIIAHDNSFNRSVLGDDACYFSSSEAVSNTLSARNDRAEKEKRSKANLEKIKQQYSTAGIIDRYENLMLESKK